MNFQFTKYHGAGNDFILIDEMDGDWLDDQMIAKACCRRTGIGADGLVRLSVSHVADFKVTYYNADGALGSLCGNGSRCAVDFAKRSDLFSGSECSFEAVDALHEAWWKGSDQITIAMESVALAKASAGGYFLDTGSPHHVVLLPESEDLGTLDVMELGKKLRYGHYVKQGGCNINWVQPIQGDNAYAIRTYERGVESETLSCGTGAVAAALVIHQINRLPSPIQLEAKGGRLIIDFEGSDAGFKKIQLTGPVVQVYKGQWPW